ncbi:MAG: inositol monophosphatase [Bacteroidetes bacterium]|nr:inositol monophosphatase [Bacteroidota bacterium]
MTTSPISRLLIDCKSEILAALPGILEKRFQFSFKPDNSPVTQSDVLIENLIIAFFKKWDPDIQVIAEESFRNHSPLPSGRILVIDPIDGTENFLSGLKEWGVSVTVWNQGLHEGSMLLLPELGEAIISGEPVSRFNSRITGFSSSFNEAIADGIRSAAEYRVTGCAVYNLFCVITGRFHRFVNPKGAYIWDLLPGIMLALEHGCLVNLNEQSFDGTHFLDPTCRYRVDITNPNSILKV